MAVYYATVLQSHTVTPDTYVSDLSFEEMLRQRFRFVSIDPSGYKHAGSLTSKVQEESAAAGLNLSFLRQEVALGEKVRAGSFEEGDPEMIFDMLELIGKNRKTFVGSSGVSATLKSVLRGVGWNAIVGKERFVRKPYFWEFRGVMKSQESGWAGLHIRC